MRPFLSLLTILAASILATAQDKHEAFLFDEIGPIGCDERMTRYERFNYELLKNPGATGYFLIYPIEGVSLGPLYGIEHVIRAWMIFFKVDTSRFVIVRAKPQKAYKTELWIVPAGAPKPDFPEAIWKYYLSRPENFFDSRYQSEVCPEDAEGMFAVILKENPTLRGHISITERSDPKYKKLLGEIKAKLSDVDASRLGFFRRRDCSGDTCGRYQLWLIPTRSNSK
jgi:hypothetical protein